MPTHVFKIDMTCDGCVKAITNVLDKHKGRYEVKRDSVTDKGISKFTIDLDTKTVEIESPLNVDQLTEILKKTGKKVSHMVEKKLK